MMRRFLMIAMLIALVSASCTSSAEQAEQVPTPTSADAESALPESAPTPAAAPEPTEGLTLGLPNVDAALNVEGAPLGTYAVAKPGAGIDRAAEPGLAPRREIPVYDVPFGPPRSLLDVNGIDGKNLPINLTNWEDSSGAFVMRVIAGGAGDEWLAVQAPSRPHDRYVWVRASDFDLGYTPLRIEIDLAGGGVLQVFDGDQLLRQSKIVHGREERPTPAHLTYLQNGVLGERVRPAFGFAILSMASFSESLGSSGSGLPSNFIHGTNQPELVGQRLSSGSIRVPDEFLEELITLVAPGTPILIFDSSSDRPGRREILSRPADPAATTDFLDGSAGAQDATSGIVPKLWRRCDGEDADRLLCRNGGEPEFISVSDRDGHLYAVAKPNAGEVFFFSEEEVEAAGQNPGTFPRRIIPVFDEPQEWPGQPRSLVYENGLDGVMFDVPLYAETSFGEPLVLSVIQMTTDGQWLQVRAPVLPHNQTVWVRGRDFELQSSSVIVEVDIGYEFLGRTGMLTVWEDGQELMAAKISAGRETRPTVLTSTYIDQIIPGETLSPAYGPWLFSTPTFSESLGTFGGGGMPQQAIHGVGPEVAFPLGQPGSSGSIHVSYETVNRLVEIEGILGARVIIFDSSVPGGSMHAVLNQRLSFARTIPIELASRDQPIGSFT